MTAMTGKQDMTFCALVQSRRAALGISLRQLEAESIDPETGEQAKRPWISKVELGSTTDVPSAAMIRALAVGLRLPLRVVQDAAACQYLGMTPSVWSEDHTTRVVAARMEEMSDEERRQLADIAETFARRRLRTAPDNQGL